MKADVDRRALLDAASRVLADEGLAALTVRRLAREVGASTMVVYTWFGDKDGLMQALLEEGFRRFAAALREPRHEDPWAHLAALGHAYRGFARDNPTYYRLLWGQLRPGDGCRVDAGEQRQGQAAFGALVEAVTRVMADLDRPAREIEPAALQVWSAVHGFVSLELAGALPVGVADALYAQTLGFIARGLGRGP